ncbi:MAG: hypothetical protein PHF05_07610 [Candidatus Izemoplasmatales bacterium]|nr:hypothetical protein [Candidatus Izemoplasmatales bacterium]
MLEFIEENLALIAIVGFIVLIIFLVVVLRYNIYMSKFFSNKKFRIDSEYTLEPTTLNKSFTLTIFNNNVNDSRIIAFGFIYKNHSLNYYKSFLKDNNLKDDHKVIILSRDCISITIDANELKTIIGDINRGKRRISTLKAYVSDSSGQTLKSKAKAISKELSNIFNIEYLEEKEKKAEIRAQLAAEVKAKKDKRAFERRMQRKARIEKFKTRIKELFTFKKKEKPKK